MDIKTLSTNIAAVEGGQWVDGLPEMGDLRLKVRGMDSVAYREAVAMALRRAPQKDRGKDGIVKMEMSERIAGEMLAEHILLDWQNMTVGGTPQPYDKSLAVKFLTDNAYAAFRYMVAGCASVVDREARVTEDAILGNSALS